MGCVPLWDRSPADQSLAESLRLVWSFRLGLRSETDHSTSRCETATVDEENGYKLETARSGNSKLIGS